MWFVSISEICLNLTSVSHIYHFPQNVTALIEANATFCRRKRRKKTAALWAAKESGYTLVNNAECNVLHIIYRYPLLHLPLCESHKGAKPSTAQPKENLCCHVYCPDRWSVSIGIWDIQEDHHEAPWHRFWSFGNGHHTCSSKTETNFSFSF